VLADGLSLAVEDGADAVVDLATLTVACVTALGPRIAGLFSTSDELRSQIEAAAGRAGEPVWPMPLPEQLRSQLDSEVADLRNIAKVPKGGAIVAALFLREFVGDVPWAHLDIAGPAWTDEADGPLTKGGTGFGVRTLLELLTSFERV
jgi:leucyl aminopeptidase